MIHVSRWTLKPYFNRYTHVMHILTPSDQTDPITWAKDKLGKAWRKRDNVVRRYPRYERHSVSIFTMGEDHDALMAEFGDRVLSHGCPFSPQAEMELLQGMRLAMRDRLYFDRYRYSVSMHARRQKSDLRQRIRQTLGETNGDWTMRGGGLYWFNLYLSEESQLVMLRLAYGNCISKVTKVYTAQEVRQRIP